MSGRGVDVGRTDGIVVFRHCPRRFAAVSQAAGGVIQLDSRRREQKSQRGHALRWDDAVAEHLSRHPAGDAGNVGHPTVLQSHQPLDPAGVEPVALVEITHEREFGRTS